VPLSKKEKLVLSHVAQGFSSKEIAEKMGLSVHTVVNHRSRLMKKTGLRRVAQLSLYAAQAGLIGETTA
jgi:DNA-binding CsgD family transcriptional regulator